MHTLHTFHCATLALILLDNLPRIQNPLRIKHILDPAHIRPANVALGVMQRVRLHVPDTVLGGDRAAMRSWGGGVRTMMSEVLYLYLIDGRERKEGRTHRRVRRRMVREQPRF